MFEKAGTLDRDFTHNDVTTANPAIGDVRSLKLSEATRAGSAVSAHGGREQYKARQAGVGSLRDAILTEGVKKPIAVRISPGNGPDVFDGHHRMYTAADINPNMEVPVAWEDHRGPAGARLDEVREYLKVYDRHPGMDEAAAVAKTKVEEQRAADDKKLNG